MASTAPIVNAVNPHRIIPKKQSSEIDGLEDTVFIHGQLSTALQLIADDGLSALSIANKTFRQMFDSAKLMSHINNYLVVKYLNHGHAGLRTEVLLSIPAPNSNSVVHQLRIPCIDKAYIRDPARVDAQIPREFIQTVITTMGFQKPESLQDTNEEEFFAWMEDHQFGPLVEFIRSRKPTAANLNNCHTAFRVHAGKNAFGGLVLVYDSHKRLLQALADQGLLPYDDLRRAFVTANQTAMTELIDYLGRTYVKSDSTARKNRLLKERDCSEYISSLRFAHHLDDPHLAQANCNNATRIQDLSDQLLANVIDLLKSAHDDTMNTELATFKANLKSVFLKLSPDRDLLKDAVPGNITLSRLWNAIGDTLNDLFGSLVEISEIQKTLDEYAAETSTIMVDSSATLTFTHDDLEQVREMMDRLSQARLKLNVPPSVSLSHAIPTQAALQKRYLLTSLSGESPPGAMDVKYAARPQPRASYSYGQQQEDAPRKFPDSRLFEGYSQAELLPYMHFTSVARRDDFIAGRLELPIATIRKIVYPREKIGPTFLKKHYEELVEFIIALANCGTDVSHRISSPRPSKRDAQPHEGRAHKKPKSSPGGSNSRKRSAQDKKAASQD